MARSKNQHKRVRHLHKQRRKRRLERKKLARRQAEG